MSAEMPGSPCAASLGTALCTCLLALLVTGCNLLSFDALHKPLDDDDFTLVRWGWTYETEAGATMLEVMRSGQLITSTQLSGVVWSLDVSSSGLLAAVDFDGRLTIIGSPDWQRVATFHYDAIAVAWSNDSARLAIVVEDRDLPDKTPRLEVHEYPSGTLTSSFALERVVPTAFNVSWNASDDRVAVSTQQFSADSTVHCRVCDLRTGASTSLPVSDAYFIGDDLLVAKQPGVFVPDLSPFGAHFVEGAVAIGSVEDGAWLQHEVVPNAQVALDSIAKTGTYLVRLIPKSFDERLSLTLLAQFRNASGDSSRVIGSRNRSSPAHLDTVLNSQYVEGAFP